MQHVNIKRAQASAFQEDKADQESRVIQIDYAMSFQCEYQDEVLNLGLKCNLELFKNVIDI